MNTNINKLFDDLSGTKWTVPVVIERTNPIPLDKSSIFHALSDAQNYASSTALDNTAYPSQQIAVIDELSNIKYYYIDAAGNLSALPNQKYVDDKYQILSNAISANLSGDDNVKTWLSTKFDISGLDSKSATQNLSVKGNISTTGSLNAGNTTVTTLTANTSISTAQLTATNACSDTFTLKQNAVRFQTYTGRVTIEGTPQDVLSGYELKITEFNGSPMISISSYIEYI